MNILYTLLVIIHIAASLLIILLVLMQSSKGEGLSGAFGMGSGSSAIFGADTANVLTKATVVLAVVFAVTCLSIAMWQIHQGQSAVESAATGQEAGSGIASDVSDTATGTEGDTITEGTDVIDTSPEETPDTVVE